MTVQCWNDLPGPCLQAIAIYLKSATDVSAARLACINWSRGVPVARVSFSLVQEMTSSVGYGLPCNEVTSNLQAVFSSLKQPHATAKGVRECVIKVPTDCLHSLARAEGRDNSCQSEKAANIAYAVGMQLVQLYAIVPQLKGLQSLHVKTNSNMHSNSPVGSAAAEVLLTSILQPLLLLSDLQSRLTSLTLNLHCWPDRQGLGMLLQQLPGLRCLSLQRCPLSVMCSLPMLASLQQLHISGLLQETVPPSYSYKHGPMLPGLPQLTRLVLRSLPLDLRVQETEGIALAQQALARQQQQQQEQEDEKKQLQKLLFMGLAPAEATARASRASSGDGSHALNAGQWVGSSIVQQCPKLHDLHTDFELGPVVVGLTQLTSLHGAHPAWLEAAAGTAWTGRSPDDGSHPCQHVPGCTQLPRLQQLRHLGMGVDMHTKQELMLQLPALKSLVLWPSSSSQVHGMRRQQALRKACTLISAVGGSSDVVREPTPCYCDSHVVDLSDDGAAAFAVNMCIPEISGLHGATKVCAVVGGAWSVSSEELQVLLKQHQVAPLNH